MQLTTLISCFGKKKRKGYFVFFRKGRIKTKAIYTNNLGFSSLDYFFLCLFFLRRFLRLCVDILCLFLFFPLGISSKFKLFNAAFHFTHEALCWLE